MTNLLSEVPRDLLREIAKLIHWNYQNIINAQIHRIVEKIEDAKEMDELNYHHLHNIKYCLNKRVDGPFYWGSYKMNTYKWVYEVYGDCRNGSDCKKRKIYAKNNTFYINNGDCYFSEPIPGEDFKKYKMRKMTCKELHELHEQ